MIVSAQAEQTASDHGSIPDHSLFGGLLFQALDQELAAKGKDFIADSDLADFLKENVVEANPRQLPDSAPFIGNDGGALVLPLNASLAQLYANAMQSLMFGDYDSFRSNTTKAIRSNHEDPLALLLQYRLSLSEGHVEECSSAIAKLGEIISRSQAQLTSTPLNREDIRRIQRQLVFWSGAISLPITVPPPVALHVFTGETEQHLVPLSGSNEFSVPVEANVYFRLRSKANETYVYVFLVDGLGRFHSQPDFLRKGQNPVDSKSEQISMVQSGPEPNDIEEWHFVLSPHPIDGLLSPPSDTSGGGIPAQASEFSGVMHYVITIRAEN